MRVLSAETQICRILNVIFASITHHLLTFHPASAIDVVLLTRTHSAVASFLVALIHTQNLLRLHFTIVVMIPVTIIKSTRSQLLDFLSYKDCVYHCQLLQIYHQF